MKENDIQKKAAATITGKTKKVTMRVNRIGWLHRLGLIPKEKTFEIRPITAGNLIRISALLIDLGVEVDTQDFWGESLKAVTNNTEDLVKVCAYAIHNDKSEPPQKLIDFILYNASAETLSKILLIVVKQLNVKDFMSSIISIKGVSLMKSGS